MLKKRLQVWVRILLTFCVCGIAWLVIEHVNKSNIYRGIAVPTVTFGMGKGFSLFEGRPYELSLERNKFYHNHKVLLSKSKKNWEDGNKAKALAQIKMVLKDNPKSIPATMTLIGFLRHSRDSSKISSIENLFKQVLKINPTHPVTRYEYGLFLVFQKKQDEAFLQFKTVSEISPMFPKSYIEMARIFLQKEKHAQARRCLKIAISLTNGGDRAPYDLLSMAFYKAGMVDSAAMVIEFMNSKGYSSPLAKFVEGLLWESAGKIDNAKILYQSLVDKDSTNQLVLEALASLGNKSTGITGIATNQSGDSEWREVTEAIDILEPLVRGYSGNGPLWFALSQAYLKRGLYAHTLDCLDSVQKYSPSISVVELKNTAYHGLLLQDQSLENFQQDELTKRDSEGQSMIYSANLTNKTAIEVGRYYLPWKTPRSQVLKSIEHLQPQTLGNGNVTHKFIVDGISFESILGFTEGKLWGIFIFVNSPEKDEKDVFGRMIKNISQLSGTGQSTGFAKCRDFRSCQGVIWEKDESVEFLAQFKGKENQARLIRYDKNRIIRKQKLCDLVGLLNRDVWAK